MHLSHPHTHPSLTFWKAHALDGLLQACFGRAAGGADLRQMQARSPEGPRVGRLASFPGRELGRFGNELWEARGH